jgi:hypothetical protein
VYATDTRWKIRNLRTLFVFGSEVLQRKTLNVVPDNLSAEPGKRHPSYIRFTIYTDYSQAGGKQPKPVTTLIAIKGK